MLPTHGTVTSVFLLANAIQHANQRDMAAWIGAAQSKSAFLATAIDHEPTARFLVEKGLVSLDPQIVPGVRLKSVSARADRQTLVAIASLILERDPPPWLPLAVVKGRVHFEVIPSSDLEALDWLGEDLELLLLNGATLGSPREDTVALGIGRAAELVVLAALSDLGESPIHVSSISDRFGYDIESASGGGVHRFEVKGCTQYTQDTFHLSRNEFEKCRSFGSEWTVVQVEFTGAALVAAEISSEHISKLREFPAAEVLSLIPVDTDSFRWESSALLTPPPHSWVSSGMKIPAGLHLPSIYTLGLEALELRDRNMWR